MTAPPRATAGPTQERAGRSSDREPAMSRRPPARRLPIAPAPAPAAAGHRPLLLAVALAAGFAPMFARAQATGAQAIVGSAALSQQGNKLTVTTTNGAGGFSAINWQSFSVPGG